MTRHFAALLTACRDVDVLFFFLFLWCAGERRAAAETASQAAAATAAAAPRTTEQGAPPRAEPAAAAGNLSFALYCTVLFNCLTQEQLDSGTIVIVVAGRILLLWFLRGL